MFFIVVEEVGKKQGYKLLDMFSGENATCSECLARRKKCEGNNPEKVREFSWRYSEEHKEEKEVHKIAGK